jgi:hypothetical protein
MALTDRQTDKHERCDRTTSRFNGKVTGLFLSPTKTGSKWTFRFTSPVTGKRRDAGLDTYLETTIADAREKALAMRKNLDADRDPIDERTRERENASISAAALTLEKAARTVHEELKPS